MSTSFDATAAIGCAVDRESLFEEITVKIGEHDFDESVMYHPKTGKKLWTTASYPIADYAADDGLFQGKWRVVTSHSSSNVLVICVGSPAHADQEAASVCVEVDLYALTADTAKLRAALALLGLWDDERFGLHALLDCG